MTCKIRIQETVINGATGEELAVTSKIKSSSGTSGQIKMTIPESIDIIFESTGTKEKTWDVENVNEQYSIFHLKFKFLGTNSIVQFAATYEFTDSIGAKSNHRNLIRLN